MGEEPKEPDGWAALGKRDGVTRADNRSAWFGLFVVLGVVVAAVVWIASGLGGDDEPDADDLRSSAFDVCTQFVEDRLKSPGSAKFRNYFQDDGEVTVTGSGDGPYIVTSSVDSENSFGALLRNNFVCEVRHIDGTQWRLVDLSIS